MYQANFRSIVYLRLQFIYGLIDKILPQFVSESHLSKLLSVKFIGLAFNVKKCDIFVNIMAKRRGIFDISFYML